MRCRWLHVGKEVLQVEGARMQELVSFIEKNGSKRSPACDKESE